MTAAPTFRIRDAAPADAGDIAQFNLNLAAETEGKQLDPAVVRRGVARVLGDAALGRYFVAESAAGEVVACAMVTYEWSDWRDANLWWFQSVYVRRDWRRRGVFRAIYAHVRQAAVEAGVYGLRLYVEQANVNAQRTYAALGMRDAHYRVMEAMSLADPAASAAGD